MLGRKIWLKINSQLSKVYAVRQLTRWLPARLPDGAIYQDKLEAMAASKDIKTDDLDELPEDLAYHLNFRDSFKLYGADQYYQY